MAASLLRDGGYLPHRLLWAVRQELVNTKALQSALAWLASSRLHLVLVGGVGTGKTLAAAKAYEIVARDHVGDRRPRYHTADELLRVAPWSEELVELERAALLVVDELGVDVDKRGRVESLLIARHERGARTIVVANMTAEEFDRLMGERVRDRIRTTGLLVACPGASLRGKVRPKPRTSATLPPPPAFAPPPSLDDLKASISSDPLPTGPTPEITEGEARARDAAQRAILERQVEQLKRRRKAGEPSDA